MRNKIISFVLVLAILFSVFAVTANAASTEEFLSDIALIYEDSIEDAKKKISGTEWQLFEYDLNAKADYWFDDGVYIIYKTSTNVEDAITDLRVMDMYGGYNISNYKKQLEESREEYLTFVKGLRDAASEFKELYKAGDKMALLAYRQMNYYKDKKTDDGTETDMLMGDFFLNLPSDDKIVQVLFEGNSFVISNIMSLLAIGISGEDENTLASKVKELYQVRDTLTDTEYYNDAIKFSKVMTEMRAKILKYDTLLEKYNLTDEEISEEEAYFISSYASLALLMEEIELGDTTLADLIREGNYEAKDLYPIVAAFTDGQKALIEIGQLETVLKYNAPSKPIDVLNEMLDETERGMVDENGNIKHIDVYLGVDRSIFKGSFAMTSEAERQQALTGETWNLLSAAKDSVGFYIAAGALTVIDIAVAGTAIGISVKASALKTTAASLAAQFANATDVEQIAMLLEEMPRARGLSEAFAEKWLPAVKPMAIVAVAVILVVVGLVGISTWYNYYNPDYTDIPNVIVDVKETDLGDKYIKYTAAKVFGEKDMNADFNAYEGKEWIALYYTKDASAGNCLTKNFVFKNNDATIARRHQGISMFGESKAFNLNSHVYSKNAPSAFVTVRYSTAKKAAEDMPAVVGSIVATGALYTLTAFAGIGAGVGGTILVQKLKKKKEAEAEA
ncbi:MAG: hypothetical protein J6Q85_04750 [Clostridia bacterium]|nr:hypothetical protein [Clostridia bacterium]